MSSTYFVEKDYARIRFEDNDYEICIDLEMIPILRHGDKIVFKMIRSKPRALYQDSDGSLIPLSHWILNVNPKTKLTFKNKNQLDLRVENMTLPIVRIKNSPKGVSYNARKAKWTATVSYKRIRYYLGRHETEEKATEVVALKRKELSLAND